MITDSMITHFTVTDIIMSIFTSSFSDYWVVSCALVNILSFTVVSLHQKMAEQIIHGVSQSESTIHLQNIWITVQRYPCIYLLCSHWPV